MRRQHPRPGVEDLHGLDAGLQLPDQIAGRGIDQDIDECRETVRILIGEQARRRLVGRALAGDHVARNRPGRPTEAQQCDGSGKLCLTSWMVS